jgi:phosphoribosylaminoimidazole (AIR) synthetase
VVPAKEQEDVLSQLKASGENPIVMGQVEQRSSDAVIIDGV